LNFNVIWYEIWIFFVKFIYNINFYKGVFLFFFFAPFWCGCCMVFFVGTIEVQSGCCCCYLFMYFLFNLNITYLFKGIFTVISKKKISQNGICEKDCCRRKKSYILMLGFYFWCNMPTGILFNCSVIWSKGQRIPIQSCNGHNLIFCSGTLGYRSMLV
jgi:hypothetical protein